MSRKGARRPRFVVIGGSRCGTTTIHAALERHPGVFVPAEKSPNYFAAPDLARAPDSAAMLAVRRHSVTTEEQYLRLFDRAEPHQICGEVSPVYLQSLHVAERVARAVPEAKVVAILRNPAERAFAHFIGRRRDGLETREHFAQTIADDLTDPSPREVAFDSYLAIGRYGYFLAPWLRAFPREQILILFFEDFVHGPVATLNQLFRFLGVAEVEADFDVDRKNQGGISTNPLLRAVWTGTVQLRSRLRSHLPKRLRDATGRVFLSSMMRPAFPEELRERLQEYFEPDIGEVERIAVRDLSAWKRIARTS